MKYINEIDLYKKSLVMRIIMYQRGGDPEAVAVVFVGEFLLLPAYFNEYMQCNLAKDQRELLKSQKGF